MELTYIHKVFVFGELISIYGWWFMQKIVILRMSEF